MRAPVVMPGSAAATRRLLHGAGRRRALSIVDGNHLVDGRPVEFTAASVAQLQAAEAKRQRRARKRGG